MTKLPEHLEIECLACGTRRQPAGRTRDELDVCPECGYVGWAYVGDLTDDERAQLQGRYRCEHVHDARQGPKRRVARRAERRPAGRAGDDSRVV